MIKRFSAFFTILKKMKIIFIKKYFYFIFYFTDNQLIVVVLELKSKIK